MAEDWAIQISPKVGDVLINIRATDPTHLAFLLDSITEDLAGKIAGTIGILQAAGNVASVAAPAAQQPPQSQAWGRTSGSAPTNTGGQDSASTPGNSAPTCQHGTKVYKTGNGRKGQWKAWMCPSPKGTPDQCPPEWL